MTPASTASLGLTAASRSRLPALAPSASKTWNAQGTLRKAINSKQKAQYLVELIERLGNERIGIVNFAGDEALSKYGVPLRITAKYGLNSDLIRPVSFAGSGFFTEGNIGQSLRTHFKGDDGLAEETSGSF